MAGESRKRIGWGALAFGLWAATAALGFLEIGVVLGISLRIYAHFWGDYWGGIALRNGAMWVLAIVWLGLVIGGGEYHYKKWGQPESWRLFGRTIAAELSILVLAHFI